MIVKTVSETEFIDAFIAFGRESQFSRRALRALYDYLWELGDSTGQPVEMDVIGICCDFDEYRSVNELLATYPELAASVDDEAMAAGDYSSLRSALEEKTPVVLFDVDRDGGGSIVIEAY